MDVLLCTASIWHMCTMSLDRYCTLRYPISYGRSRTRTSVGLKIAFVWVVSTAVCAALAVNGFSDYSNVYVDRQCVPAVKDFVLYGSILAFYVPLVIMVVTYVLTVQILAENRRTMASIGVYSTVGGGLVTAGNNDNCMTGQWDGSVAAKVGNVLRQTVGLPAGRYRRKSAAGAVAAGGGGLMSRRAETEPSLGGFAAAPQRINVEEPLTVPTPRRAGLSSTRPTYAGSNNRTPGCGPVGAARNRSASQPSTANISSPSTTSPPPNTAVDPATCRDEIGQLYWATLLNSAESRTAMDDVEQRLVCTLACRNCFKSLLQSDHVVGAFAFDSSAVASTNTPSFRLAERGRDQQRRRSDGALPDYEETGVKNRRGSNCGASLSLIHRGRERTSSDELYERTADVDNMQQQPGNARPTSPRVRYSAQSSMADASISCSAQPLNSILTSEISDDESIAMTANLSIQPCITQPQPESCHQSVEAESVSTPRRRDRLGGCSRGQPGSVEPAAATVGDRTAVRWSAWRCRPSAATDTSMSMSFASQSDTTINQFHVSTFRRSRNSVMTSTSTDLNLSASASTTFKHRRTITTKERKASKVLGIIFAVFVILWTPFFVVNVLSVVCESCLDAIGPTAMSSLTWLGYISSLANPIVYTMFSRLFRTVFYRLITCRLCRARHRLKSSTYPPSRQMTLGDGLASGRAPGSTASSRPCRTGRSY